MQMNSATESGRKQGWRVILLLLPILIAAAVIGFFVLVIVLGFALFVAAGLLLRLWWLRRIRSKAGTNQVLEGEYVVIRTSDMEGRSAEREAVPTETNAGAVFPQHTPRQEPPRR